MAGTFRKVSINTRVHGMVHASDRMSSTWNLGLLVFEDDIGFNSLKEVLSTSILAMPRFRSYYDPQRIGFVEIGDDEIDVDYHVQNVDDVNSFDEIVYEYLGNVYKHFEADPTKPLWRFTYFPSIEDGKSVLFCAIHHVIGDGTSLVKSILELLDKPEKAPMPEDARPKAPKKPKASTYGFLNRMRIAVASTIKSLGAFTDKIDTAGPLMREDIFKSSVQKHISFAETIPFTMIKDVKDKYEGGVTVNDVMIANLTLTFKAYLASKGFHDVDKNLLRVNFPINARPAGEDVMKDGSPHNNVVLGELEMPLKYEQRSQVVFNVKRLVDAVKASPSPYLERLMGTMYMMTHTDKQTMDAYNRVGNKATAMLSNVIGPKQTVSFQGHKVVDIQFGLYSTSGIYVGILSYDGRVSCGFSMDEALGDPKELATLWRSEFEELHKEVMAHDGPIKLARGMKEYLEMI